MLLEAIHHQPKSQYAYAYDEETLHIRVRTKRNDMDQVSVVWGDKYDFVPEKITTTKMVVFAKDTLYDYYHVAIKPPFRRFAYAFKFEKGDKTVFLNEVGFKEDEMHSSGVGMLWSPSGMFEFPFLNAIDVHTPPEWVKDAVFYQIFPERFANGDPTLNPPGTEPWTPDAVPTRDNFFGGDLQGVIDNLDYLDELGINCIYFTPFFEAYSNHKYDTIDYLKVDPQFGDNDKAKELVEKAHERGIRVMLDAVFNHSGFYFPPFQDVLKNGEKSRFADWFHVKEFPLETDPLTYDTFGFVPAMPKLNTENPEVKAYLLEVARYWVEDIGVDGWRLDVANEVDHRFWREFRDTVKQANPEAYILGEIWHNSLAWLQGDQFDAVMNYPVTNSILDFFVKDDIDAETFMGRLDQMLIAYPKQANEVAFNLLDSHDTPRLLHIAEGNKDRMKLAALFQLTYMGAPCIYYGDEIGMDGGGDPGCRKPMIWEEDHQDKELFDFYKKLIRLRKDHKALRDGSFRFLSAAKDAKYVAFERADDKDRFIIAMNSDKKQHNVNIEQVGNHSFTDIDSGDRYKAKNGTFTVSVPSLGAVILKKQ
ncbi:alpha-glycosidase [Salisediminibacterium selenitireducens]|uniref:Alpha amylase catalytic region n=1 Tax=Bacillus selenitireducens (strain ATCC 700615 / DSM 15326 / MLS10) TaxID=439292 RepID=D6Y0Y3_BACIE|nr:alpha-glycosidase [Salisediminibacterium selenitireducens]ADH98587.1 alpha amylase catalytic region [[Bacillus] selenitireducens MLS10]